MLAAGAVEGLIGEGVGARVLGAGDRRHGEGVETATEVDEACEERAQVFASGGETVLEVVNDEAGIGAKLYRASAEGERGLEGGDGGAVLGFVVSGVADATGDRVDLSVRWVEDGGADGGGSRVTARGAVGVESPSSPRQRRISRR